MPSHLQISEEGDYKINILSTEHGGGSVVYFIVSLFIDLEMRRHDICTLIYEINHKVSL